MALDKLNLDEAVNKAAEEAVAEADKATTPETETTTEAATPETQEAETPATTETAAETAPTDDEDDDDNPLSVPAEELARIKSDPVLNKLRKGMEKAFTQKTMEISQDRQIIQALRNPETRAEAVRILATAAGYEVAQRQEAAPKTKAETTVEQMADELEAELNTVFDPAVTKAIKPIFEKLAAKTAKVVLKQEIDPLKNATATLTYEAQRAQSEAEVKVFKAAHPNEITREIEAQMYALSQKLPAAPDLTATEYMEYLYKIVKSDAKRSEAVKEVTTRMAKAAASQEPKVATQPARVTATGTDKSKMSWDQRWDLAWSEANETVRGR